MGIQLPLSDMVGASHWDDIAREYSDLAKRRSGQEIPMEFTQLLLHGLDEEHDDPAFYQSVDLGYLYGEIDPDSNTKYKLWEAEKAKLPETVKGWDELSDKQKEKMYLAVGRKYMSDEELNEATSFGWALSLQQSLGLFNLIDHHEYDEKQEQRY